MLYGLRVNLGVPFSAGAQAVDNRRQKRRQQRNCTGYDQDPTGHRRTIGCREQHVTDDTEQDADNVRPAEFVAETVQIEAMRTDTAEKEGKRGSQRFRAEMAVRRRVRWMHGSGRRVVHRETKKEAMEADWGKRQPSCADAAFYARDRPAFPRRIGSVRDGRVTVAYT